MGCFGKKPKKPDLPAAPTLISGADASRQGFGLAGEFQPLALGAREAALSDIGTPQAANDYFSAFQPTSFEEALAAQGFQNIFPDVEASIRHNLSLSGVANSPILARQVGRARGELSVDIGSILRDLANQRALTSLQSRLNIDPNAVADPFIQRIINQSNAQANLNFNRDLAQSDVQYQNSLSDYQQKQGLFSALGTGAGAAIGSFGGPAGASIGASIGGSLASLGGGGESPISFSDALDLADFFDPGYTSRIGQGYGKNTPRGTINAGNYSVLSGKATPVFTGGGYFPYG